MPEQRILGRTCLKWKWLTNLNDDLKMTSNLQYGKVLSIAFCSPSLNSNDFLAKMGKHKLIPFSAQCKYSGV